MLTLVTALFWQSVWIRTLLTYEILLLPVLRLQAGYLGKNLEVKLSVPVRSTGRNQEFVIKQSEERFKMPMPAIGVRVCCKNTFTGECTYIDETAMASAGNTAELQFYLTAKRLRNDRSLTGKCRSTGLFAAVCCGKKEILTKKSWYFQMYI